MERLTERKTTKGITKTVIKPCIKTNEAMLLVVNKLCAFEDVLEKHNIDSVEELDETLDINNYANEIVIMLRNRCQKLVDECNIWKKACELACAEIPDADKFLEFNGITKQDDFYDQASKLLQEEL